MIPAVDSAAFFCDIASLAGICLTHHCKFWLDATLSNGMDVIRFYSCYIRCGGRRGGGLRLELSHRH